MKRREYTREFKEEAVALSNQEGVKAAQVARELGIQPALLISLAVGVVRRQRRSLSGQREAETQRRRDARGND